MLKYNPAKVVMKSMCMAIAITIFHSSTALADRKTCNVVVTSCNTDAVKANSAGHWIQWSVENGSLCDSKYKVYDVNTNVTVASGYIGTGKSRSGKIEGLYGSYKLEVTNSAWDTIGILSNE